MRAYTVPATQLSAKERRQRMDRLTVTYEQRMWHYLTPDERAERKARYFVNDKFPDEEAS